MVIARPSVNLKLLSRTTQPRQRPVSFGEQIVNSEMRLGDALSIVPRTLAGDMNPLVDDYSGNRSRHGVDSLVFAEPVNTRFQNLTDVRAIHMNEWLNAP